MRGVDFPAAVLGERPEDAELEGRELLDIEHVVLALAVKDGLERPGDVGGAERVALGAGLPERLAELLGVAGVPAGRGVRLVERLPREDAPLGREALPREPEERAGVDLADREGRGGIFATPLLLVRCTGWLDTIRLDTIWCREGNYHIPGRGASGKLCDLRARDPLRLASLAGTGLCGLCGLCV